MTRDLARSGEVRVRAEVPRKLRPCGLCGAFVSQGMVDPPAQARLIFRATQDLDGNVWVPVPHADCPDPPQQTVVFWEDDVRREAFKAATREAALARRGVR